MISYSTLNNITIRIIGIKMYYRLILYTLSLKIEFDEL